MARRRRAVLIAGPTASGKSSLALARAREMGGVVINADAMQVYNVLRVLTARPGAEEMAEVPHRLYGTVSPAIRFSTGAWVEAVRPVLAEVEAAGMTPIFVGGTGLYFDALTDGFADVPAIPEEVVHRVEAELEGLDAAARGAIIAARDPEMARRLKAPDPQRVARALAVLEATGKSLAWFQDREQRGLLHDFEVERLVLSPQTNALRLRIAHRLLTMIEAGAEAEVRALLSMNLDPRLPAMKAIGVREITDWLAGRIDREEATRLATIATHQYAKRQRTWLRNRMGGWTWIDPLAD